MSKTTNCIELYISNEIHLYSPKLTLWFYENLQKIKNINDNFPYEYLEMRNSQEILRDSMGTLSKSGRNQ